MAEPMVQDRVRDDSRTRRARQTRDTSPAAGSSHGVPSTANWSIAGAPRPGTDTASQEAHPRGFRAGLERVGLGILTTLISVNLWTGGPLLALWVGSQVQDSIGHLSETAVAATIVVLATISYLLYKLLARLNTRYNAVIGRVMPRQQAPWLKPMSGERRAIEVKRPLSATERIVVGSVVVAVLVFEVWFFFFAHYKFAS
jgi:hypothetical protein